MTHMDAELALSAAPPRARVQQLSNSGWSGPRSALVDPKVVKALSQPSTARGLMAVARQWLIIAACIGAAEWSGSWLVAIPAIILIATRQHGLIVLMHDASHYLISRNRTVNDVVANLFLTFPLLISNARYRDHHLRHHRHVNEDEDPDLDDGIHPERKRDLFVLFLQDLTFLSALKSVRSLNTFGIFGAFSADSNVPQRDKILFVAFAVVVVGGLTLAGAWDLFALYWLLPMWMVLPFLLRVRGLSEHAGRIGGSMLSHARTIDVGPVERVVFAPCNINRHLEHHLFPGVPSYNLETLSNTLRQNPIYSAEAPVTKGYFKPGPCLMHELYPATPADAR